MVIADIDHFKNINDTHGHTFGDDVICEVARTLQRTARAQDIVARIGGEEFAIIHTNTNHDKALCIAERLRAGIEARRFLSEGEVVPVRLSLGVATSTGPYDSARALMIGADAALYDAKNTGRNRDNSS